MGGNYNKDERTIGLSLGAAISVDNKEVEYGLLIDINEDC